MCEHHRAFVIYDGETVWWNIDKHTHAHINRLECVCALQHTKTTLGPKNFYHCDGETNENGKLSNVNEAMCV